LHARLLHGAALRLFLTLFSTVFTYGHLYFLFYVFLYVSCLVQFFRSMTPRPGAAQGRQPVSGFRTGFRGQHAGPGFVQGLPQPLPGKLTGTSGNRSVKTVRFPGSLDALAAPPCKAMMVRTMAKPRPLEPLALLREGSAR